MCNHSSGSWHVQLNERMQIHEAFPALFEMGLVRHREVLFPVHESHCIPEVADLQLGSALTSEDDRGQVAVTLSGCASTNIDVICDLVG